MNLFNSLLGLFVVRSGKIFVPSFFFRFVFFFSVFFLEKVTNNRLMQVRVLLLPVYRSTPAESGAQWLCATKSREG